MTAAALEVRELCVRFGGLAAVDRVSFSVPAGGITALIGPNGAGKTTLFNAITGVHPAGSGLVLLDGRPIAAPCDRRVILGGVGVGSATGVLATGAAGFLPAWEAGLVGGWAAAGSAALAAPLLPWAAAAGAALGGVGAVLSWRRARGAPDVVARVGIARTFQNLRLFRDLSAFDNVRIGAHRHLRGSTLAAALRLPAHRRDEREARRRAHEALRLVGLDGAAHRAAGHLPYGHQRRLEIARALALEPRLLLLDEPAAGLHPGEAEALAGLIRTIRERGITVLLIEHHMRLVMAVAEQVVVLASGARLAVGTPAEVRNDPRVIEAYLGRDEVARG